MYKAHVFKCVFIIFMENAKVLDKETYKLQSVNRCTYIEKTHLVSAWESQILKIRSFMTKQFKSLTGNLLLKVSKYFGKSKPLD